MYVVFGLLIHTLDPVAIDPLWARFVGAASCFGFLLLSFLDRQHAKKMLTRGLEFTSFFAIIHFSVLLYVNNIAYLYFVSILVILAAGTLGISSTIRLTTFVIVGFVACAIAGLAAERPHVPVWFFLMMVGAQVGMVYSTQLARLSTLDELERSRAQLAKMARYDALTDLPNRMMFLEALKTALARTSRSQYSLALIYLDLDYFKEVNDKHGHECGDQLLVAVAERLRSVLRAGDLAARLGGDEFTVILENIKDTAEVAALVKRLLGELAMPFHLADATIHISASIGATLVDKDSDNDVVIRKSDAAMYEAKKAGRNTFSLIST
ncbi:MAG: diguanylate cyclase domain-containing protein [Oceanococcus sp.]